MTPQQPVTNSTVPAHESSSHTVSTRTVRQAAKSWRFWIAVAVIALAIAVASLLITGSLGASGKALSPTDPSPGGSKALAEVLRQHGVNVTASTSMLETREAASAPSDTTIFLVDDGHYLDAAQLSELGRLSNHLILMTPNFDQLDAVAPDVALAGNVSGTVSADCDLGPVTRAQTVTGTGMGFRIIGDNSDAVACLGSGDDVYSLIRSHSAGTTVTVLGTSAAFSNQFVALNGNAAFALGLLGQTDNLIWMLPSIDEAAGPSAADLTPAWVSLVLALLIISTIAAGFWRGRRFGPLVVEDLPVIVPSSETMHGRARLYEKSSARLHALDALRIGTIDRVGRLCGLPKSASADDVIRATAAATGEPLHELEPLLRDANPATEAELVSLSDALLALEARLAAVLSPLPTKPENTQQPTEPGE